MTASTNGIKYYFSLLFKMTNRRIKDFGINPVVGYILLLAIFVLLSELLFYKSEFWAPYIIVFVCAIMQLELSRSDRLDFLHIVFNNKTKRKIRIVENLLVYIPFAIIFAVKLQFVVLSALLAISIILAFVSLKSRMNFTIPTPFSKRPFEFAVGFRKTFWIFPLLYALVVIAICVSNLNLGLISMVLLFAFMSSYYIKPENEYYVWIFAETPKTFIRRKVFNAVKNATCMTLPVIILMLAFFYADFLLILLSFLVGITFLTTVILAKYSTYPDEIGIPEGIATVLVLLFPPLALGVVPFFYFRSIDSLKRFLND